MVKPNPDNHQPGPNVPTKRGRFMRTTRSPYANSLDARRLRFEVMRKLIKPKEKGESGE